MRVLVTGATGFIGSEIISELKEFGYEVFYSGQKHKIDKDLNNESVKNYYPADITDVKSLSKMEILKRVDTVIHAAGLAHQFKEIEKERFSDVNVNGTKNVLELAKKLKSRHFILISSTAVYGIKHPTGSGRNYTPELEIDENTLCKPETLYAKSKLEAERTALEFCKENGILLTILRLAPVIGERNVGNMARLIEVIDKKRFVWVGQGKNFKSLIYKKDVARACRQLLTAGINKTEILNLAGEPIRMEIIVNDIAKKLGKRIPLIRISPKLLGLVFRFNFRYLGIRTISSLEQTVEKWLSDDVYSARSIEKKYGFRPATSIRQALEKQIDWYKFKGKEVEKIKKAQ